jgi:hypothetical protein
VFSLSKLIRVVSRKRAYLSSFDQTIYLKQLVGQAEVGGGMAISKVAERQKSPRRLMSRHLLGALKPSVVFQVNRDAGCSPSVTPTEVRKPDGLVRFRIAADELYR